VRSFTKEHRPFRPCKAAAESIEESADEDFIEVDSTDEEDFIAQESSEEAAVGGTVQNVRASGRKRTATAHFDACPS